MSALMLPGFQKLPAPRHLPDLPLPVTPVEVGRHVSVLTHQGPRGWAAGPVVKIRGNAALVDELGSKGGRHWHDLDDLVASPSPAEMIERFFAERPPTIVIPCGRTKRTEPSRAGDLYTGSQHRLAREAAERVAADTGGRIVILSALHGLMDLDRVIEPYDVTIGDDDAVTAERVRWQLVGMGARQIIALTPNGYTDLLRAAKLRIAEPLAGSRGIGDQRGRLARIRDHGLTPAAAAA